MKVNWKFAIKNFLYTISVTCNKMQVLLTYTVTVLSEILVLGTLDNSAHLTVNKESYFPAPYSVFIAFQEQIYAWNKPTYDV
jgi:hypothetical protein